MHGICRGNPEGLNGVITPSPASQVKAEPKAEPAHDDSDVVMEDVKAEPKSPPPPKQQVRALFRPDLHLLFLFLCLLLCHLANPANSQYHNQIQLATASRTTCCSLQNGLSGKGCKSLGCKKNWLPKLSMMVPSSSSHPYFSCFVMHYICVLAAQELAPEIAARIAEAERIAAEAEAEAAAYAEHAAAIQAEHDLQQQQERQVQPLTCLGFRLLMLPL